MASPRQGGSDDDSQEHCSGTDVAAAMGFGSFGAKPHLGKKRKLEHPNAVPHRSGLSAASLNPAGVHADQHASGSNTMPIGINRKAQQSEMKEIHQPTGDASHSTPQAVPDMVAQGHTHNNNTFRQSYPHHGRTSRHGRFDDGEWDWQALRKGVETEDGDVAYYDASFMEDPWARLKGEHKKQDQR